jgi:myo-inositol catabolism protein IolC
MPLGYASPLFALPCEQRAPLVGGVFGWREPLSDDARAQVAAVKSALYAGFRRAAAATQAHRAALVAVDPDWGVDLFRHAEAHGLLTAVTLDPPDGDAADIEPCAALRTLDDVPAPFAKVRVVPGDSSARSEQIVERLGCLMAPLRARQRRLVIELRADDAALTLRTMRQLQDGGIDPDVWILDPMAPTMARRATALARRHGRERVGCLVQLGAADPRAARDAAAAACVAGFIGFGVEPALLRADVEAWRAGIVTWDELVTLVAARYYGFIDAFAPRAQAGAAERQARHA